MFYSYLLSLMKTALIQLTHKKSIDFLREMEEADLIRVLNISHVTDGKKSTEQLSNGPPGLVHESNVEEDLSQDFPGNYADDSISSTRDPAF